MSGRGSKLDKDNKEIKDTDNMDKFATKEELNVLIKSVDELKMNLEINVNDLKKEIKDNFNKILMTLENNKKTQEILPISAEKESKQIELPIDKRNIKERRWSGIHPFDNVNTPDKINIDKILGEDSLSEDDKEFNFKNEEEDNEFNFKNMKIIDNVARVSEDIPCVKDMCGMFPFIIRMIYKSFKPLENIDIKAYKLEICKEDYLLHHLNSEDFLLVVEWMYQIMRIKVDYPSQRIILSRALNETAINAMCSFFANTKCYIALKRRNKNKKDGKIKYHYEPHELSKVNVENIRCLELENILYMVSQMILPRNYSTFKKCFKAFMEPFYPFKGNHLRMDVESRIEFKRKLHLYMNKIEEFFNIAIHDWINITLLESFNFHKEKFSDTMNALILGPLLELGGIIQRTLCNALLDGDIFMDMKINSTNISIFINKVREIIDCNDINDNKYMFTDQNALVFNQNRNRTAAWLRSQQHNGNTNIIKKETQFGSSNTYSKVNFINEREVDYLLEFEIDEEEPVLINLKIHEDDTNLFGYVSNFQQNLGNRNVPITNVKTNPFIGNSNKNQNFKMLTNTDTRRDIEKLVCWKMVMGKHCDNCKFSHDKTRINKERQIIKDDWEKDGLKLQSLNKIAEENISPSVTFDDNVIQKQLCEAESNAKSNNFSNSYTDNLEFHGKVEEVLAVLDSPKQQVMREQLKQNFMFEFRVLEVINEMNNDMKIINNSTIGQGALDSCNWARAPFISNHYIAINNLQNYVIEDTTNKANLILGDGKTIVSTNKSIVLKVELYSRLTEEKVIAIVKFLVFDSGLDVLINLDTIFMKLRNFFPNIVDKTLEQIQHIKNQYQPVLLTKDNEDDIVLSHVKEEVFMINMCNENEDITNDEDNFDTDSLDGGQANDPKGKNEENEESIDNGYNRMANNNTTFDGMFDPFETEKTDGNVKLTDEEMEIFLYDNATNNPWTQTARQIQVSAQRIANDLYKNKKIQAKKDVTRTDWEKEEMLNQIDIEEGEMINHIKKDF
jgi:hypothetical protein